MVTKTTISETQSPHLEMSYREFLEWADEDVHAEWVDGEVIIHMPPKNIHQVTLGFLYQLLNLFVRLYDLGQVRIAPFEMKLSPDGSAREPDILFVAKENLERLTEDRLIGPADLVVEIISTDSIRRDRRDKFKEYRAAGVREYWIIDPRSDKRQADFFKLNETKQQYIRFAAQNDERVQSHILPGFWLRPKQLWQAETLNPLTILFEMCGLSPQQVDQIQRMLRTGSTDNET